MKAIAIKSKEKMEIEDIIKYIEENLPQKIKDEKIEDKFDNDKLVSRKYFCTDIYGSQYIFTIECENDEFYITYEIIYKANEDGVIDIGSLF